MSGTRSRYRSIERFSRAVGIAPDALEEAFQLEREFHRRVLSERDPAARERLYAEIYGQVHPIYERGRLYPPPPPEWNPKLHLIRLLRPELEDKDVLDVGCGQGHFLLGLRHAGHRGRLVGLDASPPSEPIEGVEFRRSGVARFDLGEQFDVVMSDNAYEHVAPADAEDHLRSIHRALRPGGKAIILTPNRHFGPWDVTRIIDDTYANRIRSQGTHLNETTYGDLLRLLRANGFGNCTTVAPIARVLPRLLELRFPADLMALVEQLPGVVRAIQRLEGKDRYLAAIEITVIAEKPRSR